MRSEELHIFAESVSRFLDKHADSARARKWREDGFVAPQVWREAGEAGLLGVSIPVEYGGAGADFRFEVVLMEQLGRKNALNFAIPLHNAVVAPYLIGYGTEAQKERWLPGVASGETILAVAMSEPSAGSDLQGMATTARRDGDSYVLNGQKTFISNGAHSSLIIVAAKTNQAAGAKGISLFVVETEKVNGFTRGRVLQKLGQ
jgi:acyl-CoA dehydrogenase